MSKTSVKPEVHSSSEHEDYREENSILNSLHDNINELRRNTVDQRLDAQKEQVLAQTVDDHEQWIHASSSAQKLLSAEKTEQLLKELYASPYIGRFDLTSMESDDEAATHTVYIGKHYHNWSDKTIIGWADDSDPEKNKIITAFRRDTIEPFSARGNDYTVALKRRMIIENGKLDYVVTTFDDRVDLAKIEHVSGDTIYISDPFLLEILRRNRNKDSLTDIIATIQQQQDEIIRRPANESMIVQGCAGSGKTQILFHRLGYFKQGNKTVDWDKVHVISPSIPLRKQTSVLAKSLDIGNIPQLSLEEYYLDVLTSYNKSFRNDSFVISSEDDLPLKYLLELYSKEFTHKAKSDVLSFASDAISQAANNPHVAVKLKKRKDFRSSESFHKIRILKETIQSILTEDAVADHDRITREYRAAQEEYSALLAALPSAEESLKQIEENIRDTLHFDAKRLDNYKEEFAQLSSALDECEKDFEERKANTETRLKEGIEKKAALEKEKHDLLQSGDVDQRVLDRIYKEMPSISALKQAVETYSFNGLLRQQFDQKHERLKRAILNKIIEFQREFHTRDPSPKDFEERVSDKAQQLLAKREQLLKTIERTESFPARLQKFEKEISELQVRSLSSDDRIRLRALSKSLNDLPKNIYDKVILPLTVPLKEKHSVRRQLQIQNSKKRILYRRDLYYLLYGYYTAMGPINNEKGHIFFFDEGQNISRTDYYLIFNLSPHASFNILGDTKQCLYSQLGISSWGSLHKENYPIYTLQKNYRNTTQVVDFINQKLKTDMIPLGLSDGRVQEIGGTKLASVLSMMVPSKTALIVASEAEFESLAQDFKRGIPKLYFVSGQSPAIPKDHIPVYPVAAVRGLEFNNVLVYEKNMSKSMQYVAYSRSLQNLYLIH